MAIFAFELVFLFLRSVRLPTGGLGGFFDDTVILDTISVNFLHEGVGGWRDFLVVAYCC